MKHVIKYKLFDINNKDILTEEEVKNFFNNHLHSEILKQKIFDKYEYPFFPIVPIIEYNYDEEKNKYTLIYTFKNIKLNTQTIIRYELQMGAAPFSSISINVIYTDTTNNTQYILIEYLKKNDYEYHKKINFTDKYNTYTLKVSYPSPKFKEESFGFFNLKKFIIDLKLLDIIRGYKSNNLSDISINWHDEEFDKLRNQIEGYISIQKRGNEWVYFDFRTFYTTLCCISDLNEIHSEIFKQYLIHE